MLHDWLFRWLLPSICLSGVAAPGLGGGTSHCRDLSVQLRFEYVTVPGLDGGYSRFALF